MSGSKSTARRIELIFDDLRRARGDMAMAARRLQVVENRLRKVLAKLAEDGRQLASQRDDLIAAGANPADLDVPLHPDTTSPGACPGCGYPAEPRHQCPPEWTL